MGEAQQPPVPSTVYSYDKHTVAEWAEFMRRWHAGEKVEVDESMHDYFLDVLPPPFMGRTVTLVDGAVRRVDYGFVEGADRITGFWSEDVFSDDGNAVVGKRCFCQYTTLFSRGH